MTWELILERAVILLIQKGQWHLCLLAGLFQIIPLTGKDDCWESFAVGCIQSQLSLWEVAMITPLLIPAHFMVWIDNFHSCTCRVTLVLVECLNLPTACLSILALKFGNKWGNLLRHLYTETSLFAILWCAVCTIFGEQMDQVWFIGSVCKGETGEGCCFHLVLCFEEFSLGVSVNCEFGFY